MSTIVLSVPKLVEAIKNNAVDKLREELVKAGKVVIQVYKFPRFKLKVRSTGKNLVELNELVFNKLEYSLLKAVIEASKNNRLPAFKDVADLASDYKVAAKYITVLAEMGYVVFPDPVKASKLIEASRALSESRYQRRISKALDLPIVLNIEALEKNAKQIPCVYKNNKIVCIYLSHGEERDQEKTIVKLFNEYI
ncbi:MAG: hypothetical protein QXE10_05570 [Desulfurococcaceae archaeon]